MVRRIAKILLIITTILLGILCVAFTAIYLKQDELVQVFIADYNETINGRISIKETHIAPFYNFPNVSLDLQGLALYESKNPTDTALMQLSDMYISFKWKPLLKGEYIINKVKLKKGFLNIIEDSLSNYNIATALASTDSTSSSDSSSAMKLKIEDIVFEDVALRKENLTNGIKAEALVKNLKAHLEILNDAIEISIDANAVFTLYEYNRPTFLKDKVLTLNTNVSYNTIEELLRFNKGNFGINDALFKVAGTADLNNDLELNLKLDGLKKDFDMFLAFAPDELAPALTRYDNAGEIFFSVDINGKSINGYQPLINARFGCKEAFFTNNNNERTLDELYFEATYTNGQKRTLETSVFELKDLRARPEAGIFTGNLRVENFKSPDIALQLDSDFNLDFLAEFFNLTDLENLKGQVKLQMNFRDIIDLSQPEKAIEKVNEAYYAALEVNNLSFESPDLPQPIYKLNVRAIMDGHAAKISTFDLKMGNSDLNLTAEVSDLPAVLHHTNIPISVKTSIRSTNLNLEELTKMPKDSTSSTKEKIKNLVLDLHFNSSAKAITESPNLPIGEFFIDKLEAQMLHYPHKLNNFKADILIDTTQFSVIDFSGLIDQSDFHFKGKLLNYNLWFEEVPKGETKLYFDLVSNKLQLSDLFAYDGENFVPEEYRKEVFKSVNLKGNVALHYQDSLHSADLYLDKLYTKATLHPIKLEQFKGGIHWEQDLLTVNSFGGKMGSSSFTADAVYYLGEGKQQKQNSVKIHAPVLNLDELLSYEPSPPNQTTDASYHDSVFNIYTLPWSDLAFNFSIGKFNYGNYKIDNFDANMRLNPEHYLYLDNITGKTAGGSFNIKGYFNGSNPNEIYFNPDITMSNIDLEKLFIKFDNFGQDELVSSNIKGMFTGNITGKIKMHTDLTPIIETAQLYIKARIVNGVILKYAAFDALSTFFQDKNLQRVGFDTLQNTLTLNNGTLNIPNMRINSSLGFIEISGKQDLDLNMDYVIRVPLSLVTQTASQKLFKRKKEEIDPDQMDEISTLDPDKRIRFVNISIKGTPEDMKIGVTRKPKES